jgi:hypothetical protein
MPHRSWFTVYSPRAIRLALSIFLLLQVGYFCLAWLYAAPLVIGPWTMRLSPGDMSMAAVNALPSAQRWLAATLASASLWLLIYGALRLHRMLQEIETGAIFSSQTTGHLRGFAGATLLSVLAAIMQQPMRELLFRVFFGSGPYTLKIVVGSQDLQLILVSSVFYLIATLMQEGQRLAQENAGFV